MLFDGRGFAREIEATLRLRLRSGVRVPKIVSVLVGNDPSSELYTRLKRQAAERVGIGFEIVRPAADLSAEALVAEVAAVGARTDVTGIIIQLPIPGLSESATERVLSAIPLKKDVDGLLWEQSGVKPATVRAVLTILARITTTVPDLWQQQFVVLGAKGAVGRPLVQYLREQGVAVTEIGRDTHEPQELTRTADVVISCVGKAGLVTAEAVKQGVVAVDVGMSEVVGKVVGDMTGEVYQKASVAVPVPGGVGPVTVVSLLQNALDLI